MDTRCLVWVDVLLADLPPSCSGGLVENPDTKDAPNTFFSILQQYVQSYAAVISCLIFLH